MFNQNFKKVVFLFFVLCPVLTYASKKTTRVNPKMLIMDMVHNNPGEAPTQSKFLDPAFLKENGYNSKVFFLFEAAQFGVDWKSFDPEIFPDSSKEALWIKAKSEIILRKYKEAKSEGLKVYCMLDMLVLPNALVNKYKNEICNKAGKIDISRPFTQKCFRSLMNQMFDRFPQLDGLVIRTGETYLQDAPFYQGNSPVQNGMHDHNILIDILRDEVCVKRHKDIIYRTWDMGQLHALTKYYLAVTDSVAPHPNLYFSIKHTMVDFWRGAITNPNLDYNSFNQYWLDEAGQLGVPFNPCIGIGQHKQIVEVQCQREYEGKSAHPNYIAKGVIDGFEELKTEGLPRPYCLNQVKNNPLLSGIWTWSRGGGWGGPYIKNEFWSELNAYVVAHWAKDPSKTEKEIFASFASHKGLPKKEIENFHKLCLLSETAVMKGQYSTLGNTYVNWVRDDNITGLIYQKSYLDKIIESEKIEAYIIEKQEAVAIWKEIERLAATLHFKDKALNHFVGVTCRYGRIKYELLASAWTIISRGYEAEKKGVSFDRTKMNKALAAYDIAWVEWQDLAKNNADCPSLYKVTSTFFNVEVGLKSSVDTYRN